MNFDQILTKSDQTIDYLCQKSSNTYRKFPGTSIFQTKKNPAGMPTHRTGVDNITNPLQLIKIH